MDRVSFETILEEIKKEGNFEIEGDIFEKDNPFDIISDIFKFVYIENGWNLATLEKHITQFRNHMNEILEVEGENNDD